VEKDSNVSSSQQIVAEVKKDSKVNDIDNELSSSQQIVAKVKKDSKVNDIDNELSSSQQIVAEVEKDSNVNDIDNSQQNVKPVSEQEGKAELRDGSNKKKLQKKKVHITSSFHVLLILTLC